MVVTRTGMDTSREGTTSGIGELEGGTVGQPIPSPSSPSTPRSAAPAPAAMDPMAMFQQMMQFMAQQEELRGARYAQERREEAAQKREEAPKAARERREEQARIKEEAPKQPRSDARRPHNSIALCPSFSPSNPIHRHRQCHRHLEHLRHRPTSKRHISRRSLLVSMTVRWTPWSYTHGCTSSRPILLPAK